MAEDEDGRTQDVRRGGEAAGGTIQETEPRLLEAQTSGFVGMLATLYSRSQMITLTLAHL